MTPDGNTELVKRLMGNFVVSGFGVMNLPGLKYKYKAKHLLHSGSKSYQLVIIIHHYFITVPEYPSTDTASATPENKNPPAAPQMAMK